MTIALVLLVIALILFLLAAFNVAAPVNLGWLGLAFVTLATILGSATIAR